MIVKNNTKFNQFNAFKGKEVIIIKKDGKSLKGVLKEITVEKFIPDYYVLSIEQEDGNTVKIARAFCRAIDEAKKQNSQDNVNTL